MTTDVLVIGKGLSGLCAAQAAVRAGAEVVLLSKDGETASSGIIGFNAAVSECDSAGLFLSDTIKCGASLNDPALAWRLCSDAIERAKDLEKLGLLFDRENGHYDILKPLGCSQPRLLHSGNRTGSEAMRLIAAELGERGAKFIENACALELLIQNGRCAGAMAVAEGALVRIEAKAVVLSTGGGAGVYADSTYPKCMVGDGYALALRAGAELIDMEFVQFEPCRAIHPRKLGISTTLLSCGARLYNANGKTFVDGAETKDVLAKAIAKEIREGRGTPHGGVFFDAAKVPEAELKERHSLYYRRFLNAGIDLSKDVVEVAPAAHSFMGGVKIDGNCATSIPGLFAAGEVAGGIHGAQRLGGSAGTEVFVFGTIAGTSAAKWAEGVEIRKGCDMNIRRHCAGEEDIALIRELMTRHAGVVRDGAGLRECICKLKEFQEAITSRKIAASFAESAAASELWNALHTALSVARGALLREESRGPHYRVDFPVRYDSTWLKSIILREADL